MLKFKLNLTSEFITERANVIKTIEVIIFVVVMTVGENVIIEVIV